MALWHSVLWIISHMIILGCGSYPSLILFIKAPTFALSLAAVEEVQMQPNKCFNQSCGDLISNISYPFRVISHQPSTPSYQAECVSFNKYFDLECVKDPKSRELKLYALYNESLSNDLTYNYSKLEVVSFQNDSLIVDFTEYNATLGYNKSDGSCNGGNVWQYPLWYLMLPPTTEGGPFVLSRENQFIGMGCASGLLYTTGVAVNSTNSSELVKSEAEDVGGCSVVLPYNGNNSACNNETCCIYDLPSDSLVEGIRYAPLWITQSNSISSAALTSSLCTQNCDQTYANLYHPDYTPMIGSGQNDTRFLVKLDWAIPLETKYAPPKNSNLIPQWQSSIRNQTDFALACHANATVMPDNGVQGYRCSCLSGYEGDGYVNGTQCTNINECSNPDTNDCIKGKTRCVDTNGSYTCHCISKLHRGDGKVIGTGCKFSLVATISFSISSGIIFIVLVVLMLCVLLRWWQRKQKIRYFQQNGGFELQAYMKRSGRDTTKLFTIEELKNATNNFSDDMKIGAGGFGTVYKGLLNDGKLVAIKKANEYEDTNNNQFLNEISILTQINHRHIVKLLGTCLETSTPLLVYEYVSNGDLAENLKKGGGWGMSWEVRLKVAKQIAEALAYLHGAATPPILHRDVKSTNVLLDNNHDAKIADFGVSRLIPEGIEHVSTAIQGTLGYLDPEYFQTLQLTDKSDVYSLGVLLVELITSLKPVDTRNREPCFSNLALLFIHHMKQNNIGELIDPRLFHVKSSEDIANFSLKVENSILEVASLASCCLALRGIDRPTTKVVANELNHIYDSFLISDDVDEAAIPLLRGNDFDEVGGVVVENDEFNVQSTSNSLPINSMIVDAQPIPR